MLLAGEGTPTLPGVAGPPPAKPKAPSGIRFRPAPDELFDPPKPGLNKVESH